MEKKERSFGEIVKRFFEPAMAHPWLYFRATLVASTFYIFDIYTVLTLQKLAASFQSGETSSIPRALTIYLIVVVCMYVRKRFAKHSWWVTIKRFGPKYLFSKYFNKYISLDNTHIERVWTGKLISIIKEGIFYQMDSLDTISYSLIELVMKILFTIYLISSMGGIYIASFVLLVFLCFLIVIHIDWFANHRRRLRKENEEAFSRLFVRVLQSKMEILSSNKLWMEIRKQESIRDEAKVYNKKVNTYLRWMFNLPLLLVTALVILIMFYSYSSYIGWTFDFAQFTWLVAMTGYLNQLMLSATSKFQTLSKNFTHIDRLRNFFDETPVIQWLESWKEFIQSEWVIECKKIWFWYSEGDVVFEDFSLTIAWWKKTALVWISGSGKTTLVKLIAGYLRVDKGSIIVDWQDLSEVSLKSYYQNIWYLTQEPSVFDGTVRENLTYSLVDHVSYEEAKDSDVFMKVDQAIKNAKCEFIYDFKDGLQTEIGERGIRLSWGQRQRLAIAKIFLKDPEIIILDEPTSALDSFSEEWITEAMHSLFEGRTVIIIAHRLQTVKEADDIILLEAWKIVERGTHDELVTKGGQYAKMLELQSWF